MKLINSALRAALLGAIASSVAFSGGAVLAKGKGKAPYKIFLSMSYVGNDWQAEAQNMVTAMAKAHADKVDLQIQSPDLLRRSRSSRSMRWCRRAPTPSSSTRSRQPR